MFDVGFWELAVIGVIALVILGPERLPELARTAGMWIGRARRMVASVKEDINKELESERLKEVADSLKISQQQLQETAADLDKTIHDDGHAAESIDDIQSTKESPPTVKGGHNDKPAANNKEEENSESENISAEETTSGTNNISADDTSEAGIKKDQAVT